MNDSPEEIQKYLDQCAEFVKWVALQEAQFWHSKRNRQALKKIASRIHWAGPRVAAILSPEEGWIYGP